MREEAGQRAADLTAMLDHMADGVAMLDPALRFVAWNRRWLELWDLPAGLVQPGLPLARVLEYLAARGHGGGEAAHLTGWLADLSDPSQAIAAEHVRPGGAVLELKANPLPAGGWVLTAVDVTRHRRLETELRAAKERAEAATRAKSDFLANMSHELRTPLNAIIGFSDVVISEIFGPVGNARYRDYVENINQSGRHLLALINDILDLSKVEAGRMELHEETIRLGELVGQCLRMVSDLAMQSGCLLLAELADDLPLLQADSRRLRQVLINLLSNAIKFTPEGGRVTVRASRAADGGVTILVADTGVGIPPEDLPLVMEIFRQGRSDVARAGQGTGLGLPLAQRLVELHGGRLELSSRVGVGTEVQVRLPPSRALAGMAVHADRTSTDRT